MPRLYKNSPVRVNRDSRVGNEHIKYVYLHQYEKIRPANADIVYSPALGFGRPSLALAGSYFFSSKSFWMN
jgi:hypothetical protein